MVIKKKKKGKKTFLSQYLTEIEKVCPVSENRYTEKGIILWGYLNAYFKATSSQGKTASLWTINGWVTSLSKLWLAENRDFLNNTCNLVAHKSVS